MMGIRRTIRSTGIPGAVKVATMLTFPSGHVIEANGDELMRWLMGRLRGDWEIAGWSAGVATLVCLLNEKGQGITSILGSLRGIMFQASSPNTTRLHHFIRKLTHNGTAGSASGARLDGVRPIRVSHAGGRCGNQRFPLYPLGCTWTILLSVLLRNALQTLQGKQKSSQKFWSKVGGSACFKVRNLTCYMDDFRSPMRTTVMTSAIWHQSFIDVHERSHSSLNAQARNESVLACLLPFGLARACAVD